MRLDSRTGRCTWSPRSRALASLGLLCCSSLAPSRSSAAPAEPAPVSGAAPAAPEDLGTALRVYYAALAEKRLDAFGSLSLDSLRAILESAEAELALGRRDEAISVLAGLVESHRFVPFRDFAEGRAALFLLGDALGRAGAYVVARDYLVRLIQSPSGDGSYRRAISSLVDFGLQSGEPGSFLEALSRVSAGPAEPWAGDVAYLRGFLHERAGRAREALSAYAAVLPSSRFWAQANYRAGLLEVDQGRLQHGEQLFCRIADPKQTPRLAPLFGGNDFFQVRDLSRLALGRVAHEQYRFDDARYYYHLVPGDSDRLPEALYESATSRYEAKDYEAAHDLIGELRSLERHHAYEDEVWILDAYVDLAQCQFPRADTKLNEFLKRYEPVLAAARQLQADPGALRGLLAGGEQRLARGATGLGWSREVSELLTTSIRVDATYGAVTRQLADLDHQLSGLRAARLEIEDLTLKLENPESVKPRSSSLLADGPSDRLQRLTEQIAAVRRLLREAGRAPSAAQPELSAVKRDLIAVEAAAAPLQGTVAPSVVASGTSEGVLSGLVAADAALAVTLEQATQVLRSSLTERQDRLASDALSRLERRLTRLVRRARAGRIETVLGRKRALELEIEALSQGLLPAGAVDSLDAARYLRDDEEYWPFDGEDWEDEYVGGEGLR